MATTKEFHDYVLDCLHPFDLKTRKMMGEYLLYYNGKLVGENCDNTLFLKVTATTEKLLENSQKAYPYEGSKTLMHVVENFEDNNLMEKVFTALYDELPEKKKRK